MAIEYDESEFIDSDFHAAQKAAMATSAAPAPASAPSVAGRPATREELDARVTETQQRILELKRAAEELERKRAALEEERRRQSEFQMGRAEMLQYLVRGVGLLEEAETNARTEAEQMAKTTVGLKDALAKVQGIHEEGWTKDNYNIELTRALTILENARLEWNAARLKWPRLAEGAPNAEGPANGAEAQAPLPWQKLDFLSLCKLGLALTWPLVVVALAALGIFLALLLRR